VNELEQQRYEAELRRTPPARLPEHFMARMRAAKPGTEPARPTPFHPAAGRPGWRVVLRWLAPALAVAAVVGLLLVRANLTPRSSVKGQPLAAATGLKADDVQVDEELVSSFEVVAKLPGGQPVRFRCRQWRDQLVVIDNHRGVEIQESSPRVEVVPVRFETY
jgi:hypothetical protein